MKIKYKKEKKKKKKHNMVHCIARIYTNFKRYHRESNSP